MKKVLFPLTFAAIAAFASCTGASKPPTMFIPCVSTGDDPADRSECDCKTDRRIHQNDTATYRMRDKFFRENQKHGRTFWAAYVYAF